MQGPAWETFLGQPFEVGPGLTMTASAVSMGNPHLVLFVDEHPDRYHVSHIGPAMERHELFPEHTNVEFAHVDRRRIDVRVWERGSGETMACGSGACAVAVAANEAGLAPARCRSGSREVWSRSSVERRRRDLLDRRSRHVFDGTVDLDGRRRVADATTSAEARGAARSSSSTCSREWRRGRDPCLDPRGTRAADRWRSWTKSTPVVFASRRCAGSTRRSWCSPVTSTPSRRGARCPRRTAATRSSAAGHSDMKAGLAVMLEIAADGVALARPTSMSGSSSSAARSCRSTRARCCPCSSGVRRPRRSSSRSSWNPPTTRSRSGAWAT